MRVICARSCDGLGGKLEVALFVMLVRTPREVAVGELRYLAKKVADVERLFAMAALALAGQGVWRQEDYLGSFTVRS